MMYFPHTLQKKVPATETTDEYGHPVISGEDSWVTIGPCRCDDNTTKEFKTEDGDVYRPSYHIVGDGKLTRVIDEQTVKLQANDDVRCLNPDGSVRGSGKVFIPKECNYFNRFELWV